MFSQAMQKMVVVLLTLAILGGVGYFVFTRSPEFIPDADLSGTEIASQDILILVEKLNRISINKEFFTSVLFNSLTDHSIPINEEPKGRANPFAPVGVEGGSSNVTVSNTPSVNSKTTLPGLPTIPAKGR